MLLKHLQNLSTFHDKNSQQSRDRMIVSQHCTDCLPNPQLTLYSVSPPKMRKVIKSPTLVTSIQHKTLSPSQNNQAVERNRRYPDEKGRSQTVFSENMLFLN